MAIKMIKGLPSAGKSFELARRAKEALDQGRHVYSNFHLGYKDQPQPENLHYWFTPQDLVGIEKGLIVMDEAQVYFNSRLWSEFPIEVQYKFQQHAKDGLDIIGSVQHENRIDVVIRELVQEWIWCVNIIGSARGSGRSWGWYRCLYYWPEDLGKEKAKPIWKEWRWYSQSIADFYDTLAKIERPGDQSIYYVKMKKCPACGSTTKVGTVSQLPEGTAQDPAKRDPAAALT